jgi:hypothetical protein
VGALDSATEKSTPAPELSCGVVASLPAGRRFAAAPSRLDASASATDEATVCAAAAGAETWKTALFSPPTVVSATTRTDANASWSVEKAPPSKSVLAVDCRIASMSTALGASDSGTEKEAAALPDTSGSLRVRDVSMRLASPTPTSKSELVAVATACAERAAFAAETETRNKASNDPADPSTATPTAGRASCKEPNTPSLTRCCAVRRRICESCVALGFAVSGSEKDIVGEASNAAGGGGDRDESSSGCCALPSSVESPARLSRTAAAA